VDSVSDSHNNQRALTRHGQACIRCIQSCSRCVLNLSDSSAALTNDGSNQDMGDEEPERIGLGRCSRRLSQGFIVQCANNESKGLKHTVSPSS
jgi:hypothetical protein